MIPHKIQFFWANWFIKRRISLYIPSLKFKPSTPMSSNPTSENNDLTKLESTLHEDASTQVTDLSAIRF